MTLIEIITGLITLGFLVTLIVLTLKWDRND